MIVVISFLHWAALSASGGNNYPDIFRRRDAVVWLIHWFLWKKCLHHAELICILFPSVTSWEETSWIKTVICFLVYSFFFWFVIMLVHFTVSVLVCWLCCPIDVLIPNTVSIKLFFLSFLSWVTGADQLNAHLHEIFLHPRMNSETGSYPNSFESRNCHKSAKATCAGNTAHAARKQA